jgi:DNA invertase Pin-like site-specific DNA recombinase
MTKAYAYLRVSGKDQVDGDGYERQLLAIQQYAHAHEIEVVHVFQEQVCGSTTADERIALAGLIQALHADGIKTILIERLDRLSRNQMVCEAIVQDLIKSGYTLISVTEPDLCSNDPVRKLLRTFMSAIAEYDKDMIVAKLRGARQRMKAQTGRCEGRKPYGTREGETQVIERIKYLRSHHQSYARIASTLNMEGIKPRAGKRWYSQSVKLVAIRTIA